MLLRQSCEFLHGNIAYSRGSLISVYGYYTLVEVRPPALYARLNFTDQPDQTTNERETQLGHWNCGETTAIRQHGRYAQSARIRAHHRHLLL
jgi:hypothetical protein